MGLWQSQGLTRCSRSPGLPLWGSCGLWRLVPTQPGRDAPIPPPQLQEEALVGVWDGHSQVSPCTLVLETLLLPCPPWQGACEGLELPLYCKGGWTHT